MLCKDSVIACALLVKAAFALQGVRVKQQKLLQLSSKASSMTSEVGHGGRSPINTTKE